MEILIAIVVSGALLGGVYLYDARHKFAVPAHISKAPTQRKSLAKAKLENEVSHELVGIGGGKPGYMGLNAKKRCAVIAQGHEWRSISLGDIIGVEVRKDDVAIIQTNRGSQAVGAGVGVLLLGPAGFLVGGVTRSKKTKERCTRLTLDIYTEDKTLSTISICLFQASSRKGLPITDKKVETAAKLAGLWSARLNKLIRNSEQQQGRPGVGITLDQQLGALWKLVQQGALSKDEYENQKEILIAKQG